MLVTNLVTAGVVGAAGVEFDRPFAPLPGLVKNEEKPFRDELCLNGRWQFQPVATPGGWTAGKDAPPGLTEPTADAWDATPIKIPSPWNMNAFDSFGASDGADYRSFPSYPAAWEKVEMAWLRREFKVPQDWGDRRIVLHFEAVSGDCEVRVNGKVLARNSDRFLPFDVDVTDAVNFDGPNELLVGVRAMRFFNRPGRFGQFTHPTGAWWTGENGAAGIFGIWQDVYLHALPQTSVSDVFVQPLLDAGELRVDVELHNAASAACDVRVEARVVPWLPSGETDVLAAPEKRGSFGADVALRFAHPAPARLAAGGRQTLRLVQTVGDELKKWTPAQPNLYGLLVEVKSGDRVIDRRMTRFGWRQFGFKGRQFALNGEVMRLNIELCHFFGVAHLSPRHAWAWFRMIKDCNINAVRLHAMPYPRFYLELADEMGILVHDETAIYGSHANFNLDAPVTWGRFGDHLERLVRRDRNHACVFGWSVENETLNALKIRTSDTKEHDAVRDRFAPLVETVRRLDPTRPWISSDGGKDWSAIYPVVLAHYGPGADYYRTYDSLGKPWGVTEATYLWGRMPSEVSRYNGERAYESWRGRVEGMAFEVWDELVEKQIKPFPEISVVSVYDVTYYGLWPQPLGLGDLTRPPTLDDGVRFTAPFVEGRPGIQPERLGPYSTMLNPGYDPGLPLYQPSPVFDAARAAYAPERPQDFPRRLFENPDAPINPGPPPLVNDGKLMRVAFLGDASGALFKSLEKAGVPLAPNPGDSAAALVVDLGSLPEPSAARAEIDKTLAAGGTVLAWNLNPSTLAAANTLLPESVRVAPRSASSLLPEGSGALATALRPSRCYFSEAAEGRIIMQYGIEGPLVEKGRVVLRAADINWQLWRDRQEPLKVAAAIRSEREVKPPAAALVEVAVGKGRLLVSSLESAAPTPAHVEFFRALFVGLGVQLLEPKAVAGGILDANGCVTRALVTGPFTGSSYEEALDKDFLGDPKSLDPKPGAAAGTSSWREMKASPAGIFEFNALENDAEASNKAAYLSFWLFSPRSDNLMEGGVLLDSSQGAKVDILAGSDDGAKIWLNGKSILENRGKNPLQPDQYKLSGLSLEKGWNHFLVRVVNDRGNWQFQARLECRYPTLAPLLRTEVARPTP
jgi:beta-galactosidase